MRKILCYRAMIFRNLFSSKRVLTRTHINCKQTYAIRSFGLRFLNQHRLECFPSHVSLVRVPQRFNKVSATNQELLLKNCSFKTKKLLVRLVYVWKFARAVIWERTRFGLLEDFVKENLIPLLGAYRRRKNNRSYPSSLLLNPP